ncbi:MAG: TonB C-terminal domain-containing protein [Sulfuricurvum sp.]|jgi:protein TonB|uniref:TonB C-terminal domain-containing protein n=1 Tax=Sulfuricurvum sp. TaxID=2025608 RepID=UPI0025E283C0|nr:TonB C-terminal domain-containing protein [Sulfuricurvum sp.]MCK9373836.1 TonB C-terminal domain-containing protein [Sulfuricurvum sp.]
MGFNDERYFFMGGAIAFSLFAFLLFLIGFTVISSDKIENFALLESPYISISMTDSVSVPSAIPIPPVKPQVSEPEPDIAEVQPEVTKPQEKILERNFVSTKSKGQNDPKAEKQTPAISDLFSSVPAQKTSKVSDDSEKKLEVLNEFERQISRTKPTSQLAEKVKNTSLIKPAVKIFSNSGSTGPLVNEYHAKIQALIYANYYPPTGSQGQSARVRLQVDGSGKLIAYRVITYSGNTPFNNEIDFLKERLRNLTFPANPDGKNSQFEIILTAKE